MTIKLDWQERPDPLGEELARLGRLGTLLGNLDPKFCGLPTEEERDSVAHLSVADGAERLIRKRAGE